MDISYDKAGSCDLERDVVLWISYLGNKMDIYLDGRKINDHFYTGQEVPVSLRYFGFPEKLQLVIQPLRKDEPVYLETWPEMEEDSVCSLEGVRLEQVFFSWLVCAAAGGMTGGVKLSALCRGLA